jgi:archaellum component FlaC
MTYLNDIDKARVERIDDEIHGIVSSLGMTKKEFIENVSYQAKPIRDTVISLLNQKINILRSTIIEQNGSNIAFISDYKRKK